MMNKTSNFAFFSIIFLPALLLFFQNCSELVSNDSNLSSFSDLKVSMPPILLDSSSSLGFTTRSDCKSTKEQVYFNEASHFCFLSNNECEESILTEKNFKVDEGNLCSASIDLSNFKSELLNEVEPEVLGYEDSEDLVCTQQYMSMISLKNGLCAEARDGCQISFLESMGFSGDTLNLCN